MLTSALVFGSILLGLPTQLHGAVIHEQLTAIPGGWAHASTPSDSEKITLEIALAQSNITEMIAALYAVSTPGSSEYGKYWTGEAVNSLIGASDEAKLATTSWLKDAGVDKISQDGNYITFATTIGTANTLLNTKFHYYQNEGVEKLRTTQYSVAKDVAKHIDFISPTIFFGKAIPVGHPLTPTTMENPTKKRSVPASCITGLTVDCVRQLNNVPLAYRPKVSSGASLGFGSFLNQSAIYSDLFLFEEAFGIPTQNFSTILFNGATNDQDISTAQYGEADLDAENIFGLAHPLPVTEFITGGSPPIHPDDSEPAGTPNENEPYLPYYQALLKMTNEELPQSISNSYGDDEQTVPLAYATHVCNLIGTMGLRGITILESSGDLGVGAGCTSNKGQDLPRFNPIFPATCPYVTAVGGTQGIPQIAWVGSSGGFSDYFARPYYQQTAVNTYLNEYVESSTVLYYSKYTNFSGRGFPDVAADSLYPWYYVYYGGKLSISGGTSAAAPVFNAIVALLNAALLDAGKPALGWLNPWLYSSGHKYLKDITGGQSIGCNGNNTQTGGPMPGASIIPYAFWNATVGWDPATGWGIPNFKAMLAAVLAM